MVDIQNTQVYKKQKFARKGGGERKFRFGEEKLQNAGYPPNLKGSEAKTTHKLEKFSIKSNLTPYFSPM